MREAITLTFELIWLLTLAFAIIVGLLGRHPAGRRRLKRWIKLPTIIWWETERADVPDGDVACVLSELRSTVPGAGRSLLPAFYLVRVTEDCEGKAKVTVRAATLMQAKTPEAAGARIGNAVAGSGGNEGIGAQAGSVHVRPHHS